MGVYNGAEFLATAIESVLTQRDVEIELIVVDDGSSDESPAMLERYASIDGRVRVLRTENAGLTRALIRGCREARGSFIARQDADDASLPGRLAALAAVLRVRADVCLVYPWVRFVGPIGEIIAVDAPEGDAERLTAELRTHGRGVTAHGSVMFRRSAYDQVGGYRDEFYFAQDYDLWLRMIGVGKIACVPQPLYELRYHDRSISSNSRPVQKRFAELARQSFSAETAGDHEAAAAALDEARQLRDEVDAGRHRGSSARKRATTYCLIGTGLASQSDPRALIYFRKSIREWPFIPGAWHGLILQYFRRSAKTS